MNLPSTFASASMNSPRSMALSFVEPLTGVRRVDEEERVLAVVGLERLAVVLPQDAHVPSVRSAALRYFGVGRRAEVAARVRAVGAAVAGGVRTKTSL